MNNREQSRSTPGLTLHSAWWYDFTVRLFAFGRERAFRSKMLEPAQLRPGEAVLDVGCGTGSLALLAKMQVGASGEVHGIDASPEMITRARAKARTAPADVHFVVAPAQALPFPDASFDVVLSSLMFHHLPRPSREQLGQEMRRVLKPGGRALAVDFAVGSKRKGLVGWIHASHGSTKAADIEAPLRAAGLDIVASAPLGPKDLHYVLAQSPGAAGVGRQSTAESAAHLNAGRHGKPLHMLLLALAASGLLAIHLGTAAWVAGTVGRSSRPLLFGGAAVLAAIVLKLTIAGRLRSRWLRHGGF